jgi:Bacterial protein of unknown function (DUF916)
MRPALLRIAAVRHRTAAAVLCAAAVILAPAATATAAARLSESAAQPHTLSQATTFAVQPATAGKPDARAYLSYSATPGAIIKDQVAIRNYSEHPLTLRVYAGDAFNAPDGGFDLQAAAATPVDLGAWISVDQHEVTVPARSSTILPIRITVPADATPGDHAAGIVAALDSPGTDSHGNRITVEDRVGSRVYLRISGPLRPGLAVQSLHISYHAGTNPLGRGSALVTYTVRNTGNVRLSATQAVRITNLVTDATARGTASIAQLLPGNSITVTARIDGILPAVRSHLRITLTPHALPGDLDPPLAATGMSVGLWTVSWTLLGLVLVVIVLLVLAALWWSRRRRPAPAVADGTP